MPQEKRFNFNYIKKQARELRLNMTDPEKVLWKELRNRKFFGLKFLRQHPVLYKGNLKRYNFFIADFYCDRKKLIIELDGPIHERRKEYDEFRDSELKELGFKIRHIKNEELTDLESVLKIIEQDIS